MNRVVILIFACLFPAIMVGQADSVAKLFNKYKNVEGFELELSDTDFDFNGNNSNFLQFLDGAEKMYVLSFDSKKGSVENLEVFKSKLNKLADKKHFNPVVDISGDGDLKILIRTGDKDEITQLLMMLGDEDESSFIYASQ